MRGDPREGQIDKLVRKLRALGVDIHPYPQSSDDLLGARSEGRTIRYRGRVKYGHAKS